MSHFEIKFVRFVLHPRDSIQEHVHTNTRTADWPCQVRMDHAM